MHFSIFTEAFNSVG